MKAEAAVSNEDFDAWVIKIAEYLIVLQDRLFSSGLHVLGNSPSNDELKSYLSAYFGETLSNSEIESVISTSKISTQNTFDTILSWIANIWGNEKDKNHKIFEEAQSITKLLMQTTEELDSIVNLLDGGYILPAPGGDLLRYVLNFYLYGIVIGLSFY